MKLLSLLLAAVFLTISCSGIESRPVKTFIVKIDGREYYLERGMAKTEVMALFGNKMRDLWPKAPGYILETGDASYRFVFEFKKLQSVKEEQGLKDLINDIIEKREKR